MAFLWLDAAQSLQQIALLTNTGIHVLMYYYYFMCTINRPPKWKKLVTQSQIVQFVFRYSYHPAHERTEATPVALLGVKSPNSFNGCS